MQRAGGLPPIEAANAMPTAVSPRAATFHLLRLSQKSRISMTDAAITQPRDPVRKAYRRWRAGFRRRRPASGAAVLGWKQKQEETDSEQQRQRQIVGVGIEQAMGNPKAGLAGIVACRRRELATEQQGHGAGDLDVHPLAAAAERGNERANIEEVQVGARNVVREQRGASASPDAQGRGQEHPDKECRPAEPDAGA